jgi:hypothetical protein
MNVAMFFFEIKKKNVGLSQMSRRHSDYLVFAKILGLFETAERA